jgi:hypothetical protein
MYVVSSKACTEDFIAIRRAPEPRLIVFLIPSKIIMFLRLCTACVNQGLALTSSSTHSPVEVLKLLYLDPGVLLSNPSLDPI